LDAPETEEIEAGGEGAEETVEDAGWHGPMLRELAELGMRMARAVTSGAEARAQSGEATAADEAAASLALQRAAKMVRMTVALDRRLDEAAQAVGRAGDEAAVDWVARQRENAERSLEMRRKFWRLIGETMVREAVERSIETEADPADRERLFDVLDERLADKELEQAGPGQYEGLIVSISQGLGLSGERPRRAFADGSAMGASTDVHAHSPP